MLCLPNIYPILPRKRKEKTNYEKERERERNAARKT